MENDSELQILNNIYNLTQTNPMVNQREISTSAGFSLGMTNTLLKKLSKKGLIMMKRISSRNIQYIITPSGFSKLAQRTYSYVKKTVSQFSCYKNEIKSLVFKIKEQNYSSICLIGKSELDFIIEYSCNISKIQFVMKDVMPEIKDDVFVIWSEQFIPNLNEIVPNGQAYLSTLIKELQ